MTSRLDNKIQLLGIYSVKSPYHEEYYNLPFIISSYRQNDDKYNVLTIEYKAMTACKVDTYYSKESISQLIDEKIIIKEFDLESFKENQSIKMLVKKFAQAQDYLE